MIYKTFAHFLSSRGTKRNTKCSKYRFRHVVLANVNVYLSLCVSTQVAFSANFFFKYIKYFSTDRHRFVVQDTNLFRHWAVFRFIDNFMCKNGKFDIFSLHTHTQIHTKPSEYRRKNCFFWQLIEMTTANAALVIISNAEGTHTEKKTRNRTFFGIDFRQAEKHFLFLCVCVLFCELCVLKYCLNNGLKSFSLCFKWFFFHSLYVWTLYYYVSAFEFSNSIRRGSTSLFEKSFQTFFNTFFFHVSNVRYNWWRWWGMQDVWNSVNGNVWTIKRKHLWKWVLCGIRLVVTNGTSTNSEKCCFLEC